MDEDEVGSEGREGEKPPAMEGGQGAMTSFGCGGADPGTGDEEGEGEEEGEEGREDKGLQSSKLRCLAMNRTMGEVRKSSSVHCSHRSRSVVSVGVSRWRGLGVVIVVRGWWEGLRE